MWRGTERLAGPIVVDGSNEEYFSWDEAVFAEGLVYGLCGLSVELERPFPAVYTHHWRFAPASFLR